MMDDAVDKHILFFRTSQGPHATRSQSLLCQEGWRADQHGHPLSCKQACLNNTCINHQNKMRRKLHRFYVASSLFFKLLRESPNLRCPGLKTVSRWTQRESISGTVTRTASFLSARQRGTTLVFTRCRSKWTALKTDPPSSFRLWVSRTCLCLHSNTHGGTCECFVWTGVNVELFQTSPLNLLSSSCC